MQKVSIHYVLKGAHKGQWSICDRVSGSATYGKVIAHQPRVVLHGCDFRVSEPQRLKVIAENSRKVHARVWGLCDLSERRDPSLTSVHYNPYRAPTFTLIDGTPVYAARTVIFHSDGRCYI
jgi:hypothetical protein